MFLFLFFLLVPAEVVFKSVFRALHGGICVFQKPVKPDCQPPETRRALTSNLTGKLTGGNTLMMFNRRNSRFAFVVVSVFYFCCCCSTCLDPYLKQLYNSTEGSPPPPSGAEFPPRSPVQHR